MEEKNIGNMIELGTWIGRKQAFGLIVGRCSAADAHCLRAMREDKRYRETGLKWEEFCPKYLGMSRAQADKTIRQMEEFGEAFFHLAGLTRVTEQAYRLIAGAVSQEGVEYRGARIAIEAANAGQLAAAVEGLLLEAKPPVPKNAAAPMDAAALTVQKAAKLMHGALAELHRLMAARMGAGEGEQVQRLIASSRERLEQMAQSPGIVAATLWVALPEPKVR